jgi:peptidoglycan hydrolase CwlO-like protein
MKKSIITLLAVAMVAVSVPAFAMEHKHDASQKTMDEQCVKECDLLLKNCALEVDSIQQRITKLRAAINEKGADTYTLEELKILNKKLKETNETLRALTKPGH